MGGFFFSVCFFLIASTVLYKAIRMYASPPRLSACFKSPASSTPGFMGSAATRVFFVVSYFCCLITATTPPHPYCRHLLDEQEPYCIFFSRLFFFFSLSTNYCYLFGPYIALFLLFLIPTAAAALSRGCWAITIVAPCLAIAKTVRDFSSSSAAQEEEEVLISTCADLERRL